MNARCAVLTTVLLAGVMGARAQAYTANLTFAWGYPSSALVGWSADGVNTFPDPAVAGNAMRVSEQDGYNTSAWFNADFAAASDYDADDTDDCRTPLPGYEVITLRKYGCRHSDADLYYAPVFRSVPVADAGYGAVATGTVTVTDTTLYGTLSVVTTTDEPQGATTRITSAGLRTSDSPGDGLDGFNLRVGDGSPFGNAWYGVTAGAMLWVNLTGRFDDQQWIIDGGTVTFDDPGFACQQGGFGGGDERGELCTESNVGGGFQNNGGHLSWGMDPDGAGTGSLVAAPIELRDETGSTVLTTLSGVQAQLTVYPGGNIVAETGEIRMAVGSASGGCSDHIRWGGDTDPGPGTTVGISCGTLLSVPLAITGVTYSLIDMDNDDVHDLDDNCMLVPNPDQRDSNDDGYGNVCDPDLDDSGLVTADDYALLRARLHTADADADLNGSGLVTVADWTILRSYLNKVPGPAGPY